MTDHLAPLFNLASPTGVITLLTVAGGIYLFILSGLGGVGERDLPHTHKNIIGALGILAIIAGCIGMILVTYPTISLGMRTLQNDLGPPTDRVSSVIGEVCSLLLITVPGGIIILRIIERIRQVRDNQNTRTTPKSKMIRGGRRTPRKDSDIDSDEFL